MRQVLKRYRPESAVSGYMIMPTPASCRRRHNYDVRHSYATAGRAAKIDWKALSRRIGHADVALTMKQYVQTDLEADRQVANTLAELIIGGALASTVISDGARGTRARRSTETLARRLEQEPRLQIRLQTTCKRRVLRSRTGLWPW